MKSRTLASTLLKAARTFPAVVLTGPRQSGKTTLLKNLFQKTHRFISLEDPDARLRAKNDPLAFLERYAAPVILDEIQYVPELLSYIKTKIDHHRKPGSWLFTGSQNFVLMEGVSQSLAGRAAVLSLLPFSYMERLGKGHRAGTVRAWLKTFHSKKVSPSSFPLHEVILRGNYPEIASKKTVDRGLWCGSYVSTYLERDVRNLAAIGDLGQFEHFLKNCAIRTGQIFNLSEVAKEIGVSVPTTKRWLSILQTGYIVYLLQPYYKNIGKRLVKAPKLYFCDTGLASYLLGIHDKKTLAGSPNFGNLFETMIINDVLKRFLHAGQIPSMYYLKTRDGLEVDLALEVDQKLHLFEIKSGMTITPKHAVSLERLLRERPEEIRSAFIISNSSDNFPVSKNVININWKTALTD